MRKTLWRGGNGNGIILTEHGMAAGNGLCEDREWEWALRGGESEKDSAGMGMTAYPLPL
jgi:hypothetical protein